LIRNGWRDRRGQYIGRKYSIDYYQREYKMQTKQVTELIDDLAAFAQSHLPDGKLCLTSSWRSGPT